MMQAIFLFIPAKFGHLPGLVKLAHQFDVLPKIQVNLCDPVDDIPVDIAAFVRRNQYLAFHHFLRIEQYHANSMSPGEHMQLLLGFRALNMTGNQVAKIGPG